MKLKLALAAGAAALGLASPANALLYSFTLTGDYEASWQIDSSPTPDLFNDTFFLVSGVEGVFPGRSADTVDLYFFAPEIGGGLVIYDVATQVNLADAFGGQLFSGATASPTFLTGSYDLTGNGVPQTFRLVIAEAITAVPEPATWAMMIAGFGLVGGAMRRTKVKASCSLA